jgi:hypothetical protein
MSLSSCVGGSPMVDADAIAEMASGNLIRNLHLDDDNTGIQGHHLDMGSPVVVVVNNNATVIAPNAPAIVHTPNMVKV